MNTGNAPALLIAAPASNSGKTTLTLSLLRAFQNLGINTASFKVGPDYIDPVFHHRASGQPCVNIDPWGMRPQTQNALLDRAATGTDLVIGEGVMGLFDGARDGTGSTADLADAYQIPIILIVPANGQSTSVGALLHGFNSYRNSTKIAGVIFNNVGSPAHGEILNKAAAQVGIPCLGMIPKSEILDLPRRHLGLIQADENTDLDAFLESAANLIQQHIDLPALQKLAMPPTLGPSTDDLFAFPARHIAVARDAAFTFIYPHFEQAWRQSGRKVSFFSPLGDEVPSTDADFIYLPGGYPELHLPALTNSQKCFTALQTAKANNIAIYGECGGYMVMGQSITGKDDISYPMADLLPIRTSFATPKLHLGYRRAMLETTCPLAAKDTSLLAHEFHYAEEVSRATDAQALFRTQDALGKDLGGAGVVDGSAFGSFIHLIDKAD